MPALAAIHILVILVLMIGFRWGAARAGAAGYLAAFLVAVVFFGASSELLAYAQTKAFILSTDVLFIIWAAYILYRVADEAGSIQTIGRLLPSLTRDRGMQALLIGWVFAYFLQGAGGFGVPVAVTAPLLIGLGFSPLNAVIIPYVGHDWSATFGSLGSPFNALLSASLAPASSFYLGLACLLIGLMVAYAADGLKGVKRLLLPALVIGIVMWTMLFAVVFGAGAFPLIAPWIGAIGAFMTGSNTNSNVVFAGLQMRTAELLAYSVPAILAGQTAGAAVACVVVPSRNVVVASTAGLAGKKGDVLRPGRLCCPFSPVYQSFNRVNKSPGVLMCYA